MSAYPPPIRRRAPRLYQRLQARLLALALLLVLIPILVIGLLAFTGGREAVRDNVGATLEEIAASTAADVRRFLNDRTLEVSFIANAPIINGAQPGDVADKQQYLDDYLRTFTFYRALVLTNGDGEIIAATDGSSGSRADQEWFRRARSGRVFISDVMQLDDDSERVLMFAAPIYLPGGGFQGVIASQLDAERLVALVRDRQVGEDGRMYIVNESGIIMASASAAEMLLDISSSAVGPALTEGERGYQTGLSHRADMDMLLAYAPLPAVKADWDVLIELPLSELDGPSDELAQAVVLIALVAAFIALAAGYPLSRGIVRPVQQITDAAQQISEGTYNAPLPPSVLRRRDEVGQLARGIADMQSALAARDAELRELNRSLEARVESRTFDLTKANENLRITMERLREASRIKSEFLANVSHELRTPLNAIIGFSDMLLAGMSGELNDKQQHKIARLRDNGSRLLTLINDLLDLTRIEAGRLEVLRKPFEPRSLIEHVRQQTEVLAQQKGLEFGVRVDDALPAQLIGDEPRIEQIVVNLLSNAFKFTKAGSVTLAVQVDAGSREWSIRVSDTGIGIPPHAIDLIFEEFRQVDGSQSRSYKGTGLGLAITRNLVRMMDGKIEVHSELEKGSTFIVRLPLITELSHDETILTEVLRNG